MSDMTSMIADEIFPWESLKQIHGKSSLQDWRIIAIADRFDNGNEGVLFGYRRYDAETGQEDFSDSFAVMEHYWTDGGSAKRRIVYAIDATDEKTAIETVTEFWGARGFNILLKPRLIAQASAEKPERKPACNITCDL